MLSLRPFQRRAVKALESGAFDVIALCTPRAQGKSSLAAELCFRALRPGDSLYRAGTESHLVAATIGAARKTCFKLLRRLIEGHDPDGTEYKVSESANACHIRRRDCNTRVSVVAGSAQATLGLVGCPWLVIDEPGAVKGEAAEDLWGSIVTALGKPDSPLRVFVIGHLAPFAVDATHWYHRLVYAGTRGRTWIYLLQGRAKRWDSAAEIRRCSPLSWRFADARAKLLEQRDEARKDARARAEFWRYRLNLPARSESEVVVTAEAWRDGPVARPVPPPAGRPVIGIDTGSNRSWSAAAIAWPNGRLDGLAVTPGIPDLRAQERRDGAAPGRYQALAATGRLLIETGHHEVRIPTLIDRVMEMDPEIILCDNHRLPAVLDAVGGRCTVIPRRRRHAESTDDILGARRQIRDGNVAVIPEANPLYVASMRDSLVQPDEYGNLTLVKPSGKNQRSRDDLVQALVMALGALDRRPPSQPYRVRVRNPT